MHALIVAASGGPNPADPATRAAALAAAWSAAAPRCDVEPLVLPRTPGSVAPGPGVGVPRPTGVFVPTTSLGLSSVGSPPAAPEVTLLAERAARADLVVVHVGVLDGAALHEGPVAEAARAAAPHAVPVVVLAGRSEVSRREQAAGGVAGVHVVGEPWDDGAVGRAARTWAPAWGGV
ncbi:glycerate kinase [Isoptericola croceus]|uniref:glycerate kinase n=1 Tax=Isoptericola croceus TaxID=3031406 RepID=UPI0023F8400C|nr:glycerate kinase [Isoptericola croceus]